MRKTFVMAAATLALLLGASQPGVAGGKDRPKPSVNFAKTWEAAVEEARLLNVPIVVHRHGFY